MAVLGRTLRTMEGGTASVDSAIKAAGGKASDGQSVRIAINLDGVSNDGAEFARQMREGIKADRRKPPSSGCLEPQRQSFSSRTVASSPCCRTRPLPLIAAGVR